MTQRKKRTLLVLAIALVGLFGAFGAYSYWTTSGSGSGTAQTGTTAAITVNQTSTPTGLYPGGSVALSGTFTNGNAFPVFVGSVTATVDTFSVQADAGKPACTQADFSITGTAPVNAQVPVGTGVGSWSGLSLAMTNAATNQDNCKNITVPITYAATA